MIILMLSVFLFAGKYLVVTFMRGEPASPLETHSRSVKRLTYMGLVPLCCLLFQPTEIYFKFVFIVYTKLSKHMKNINQS